MIQRFRFGIKYLGKPPWDTGVSPPELMIFIASHSPGKALDLGCGTGTNAITLANNGWEVTGVDFSGKAVRSARRKARQAGAKITFIQGDVSRLKGASGPFDLVLDIGCLHSLPARNRKRYAARLPFLLSPGGTFLLYAWMDEEGQYGMGLGQDDLDLLTKSYRTAEKTTKKRTLHLIERQEGTERGARPSAWLAFQCIEEDAPPA